MQAWALLICWAFAVLKVINHVLHTRPWTKICQHTSSLIDWQSAEASQSCVHVCGRVEEAIAPPLKDPKAGNWTYNSLAARWQDLTRFQHWAADFRFITSYLLISHKEKKHLAHLQRCCEEATASKKDPVYLLGTIFRQVKFLPLQVGCSSGIWQHGRIIWESWFFFFLNNLWLFRWW